MGSSDVAKHYNAITESSSGLEARSQSRIYYLRNFNNWAKSMLIGDYLRNIKDDARRKEGRRSDVVVLDLCCGKGGDLLKWKKGEIDHLVCADIADVSLKECQSRFEDNKDRGNRERRPPKGYTAEFIHADCSKVRLRDRYKDANTQFDLCSCQFSLHYSFASNEQANCMLRNACENLKPGGYFIGTIPNAYQIVRLVEKNDGSSFKNNVCAIRFDKPVPSYPLFGATYDFKLHDVVNLPEYLVYFNLLVELVKKYDMELVYKQTFPELFEDYVDKRYGKDLLARMEGLEPYPADKDVTLTGGSEDDEYEILKAKVAEIEKREKGLKEQVKVGTLSKSEWEAAGIYMAFAFRKKEAKKASNKGDEETKKPSKGEEETKKASKGEDETKKVSKGNEETKKRKREEGEGDIKKKKT